MKRLTFGSLFAGIGGFDLGLERAGMECHWQVEIDRACQSVLRARFPQAVLYEDVRSVGSAQLVPVDVITFGSPCQDLSVAGKRRGMRGERSGLYFEAIRIIRELRPKFAVWENVPGALSSNTGRDFGAALDALAESGALDIGWRVLDAQWFGVAQRRRRVFVVADFRGRRAAQILFEPESCNRNSPPSREAGQKVAGTLTGGSKSGRSHGKKSGSDREEFIVPDVAYTLPAAARGTGDGHGNAWNSNYVASDQCGAFGDVAQALCSRTAKGGDPTTDTMVIAPSSSTDISVDISPPLRVGSSVGISSPPMIAHTIRSEGCDASEDGTGRGVPLVCDTTQITSGANYSNPKPGDACHPLASGAHPPLMVQPMVRRLTPVECSRLQGFPDEWLGDSYADAKEAHADDDCPHQSVRLSDSARYRMLGNAVVVNVSEWIGRRIIEAGGHS